MKWLERQENRVSSSTTFLVDLRPSENPLGTYREVLYLHQSIEIRLYGYDAVLDKLYAIILKRKIASFLIAPNLFEIISNSSDKNNELKM